MIVPTITPTKYRVVRKYRPRIVARGLSFEEAMDYCADHEAYDGKGVALYADLIEKDVPITEPYMEENL